MCRMRLVPERVDDEQIHTVEQRPRLLRNLAAVGQVGEGTDAIAQYVPPSVEQRHGRHGRASEAELPSHGEEIELWQPATTGRARLEDVAERSSNLRPGERVGV